MAEPTARAYRDVLAIPDARALIGASAASEIGNWLYNAALLGYVYSATHSAGWVGAATICRLLPYVLLGPFGGAIADRYSRRTVLLAGDAVRVLLMAAVAATVAGAGPVALVIALTAVASAAGCAEKPAAMALVPREGPLRILASGTPKMMDTAKLLTWVEDVRPLGNAPRIESGDYLDYLRVKR